MLKTKYKIHRLVNIAFYFIIFLLGFLIGGGKIEEVFKNFSILF